MEDPYPLIVMLDGGHVGAAYQDGLLDQYLPPQFSRMRTMPGGPHHLFSPAQHCVLCCRLVKLGDNCGAPRYLKLAALLHDIGKADTLTTDPGGTPHYYGHEHASADIAHQWDQEVDCGQYLEVPFEHVVELVRHHMVDLNNVPASRVLRWRNRWGAEWVEALVGLRFADWSAGRPDTGRVMLALQGRARVLEMLASAKHEAAERAAGRAPTLRDLAVDGAALMQQAGLAAGPELGAVLRRLQEEVNRGRVQNSREELLRLARIRFGDQELI